MAGVTDYAFRRICRLYGASLTVTEMVSAKAIYYNDLKTASLARLHEDDAPCAIQLFGSEPDILAYAAEKGYIDDMIDNLIAADRAEKLKGTQE